jgi:hypothetical protein
MSEARRLSQTRRRIEERRKLYETKFQPGMMLNDWEVVSSDLEKNRVICRCKCGIVKSVCPTALKTGQSKRCWNCGLKTVAHRRTRLTHLSVKLRTKLAMSITAAITRCINPQHKQYKNYGGRGIKVYTPWIEDRDSAVEYLTTLPGHNDWNLVLDREDNDGHYEPGNLRFVTYAESIANQRPRSKC